MTGGGGGEECGGQWAEGLQDDFLLNCRGRYPQVSRKRDGFKEQPLEADGSGTHGECRVPGFPLQVLFSCF